MPHQTLRNSKNLIFLFFVLLWMMFIFIFSSQPYESQDLKPWLQSVLSFDRIPVFLYHIQLKYGGHLISIKTLGLTGFVEFFIRKLAHVAEYALLGVLVFQLLRMSFSRFWGLSLISISLCYLYGVTDEYHQSFVASRTPLFVDILLDTGGAALGILVYIFLSKVVLFMNHKLLEYRLKSKEV